jgi:hypothetical protein
VTRGADHSRHLRYESAAFRRALSELERVRLECVALEDASYFDVELPQSNLKYELIVGFTRLGNLLGALDRQDLPEHARHRVWIVRRNP